MDKNWRIKFILVIFLGIGATILGRLFFLQIINHKFYQSQALGQQAGFKEVQGKRGEIYFSNSQESKGQTNSSDTKSIAVNKKTFVFSVNPNNIDDKKIFAKQISKIINTTDSAIVSKLSEDLNYVVIKKDLSQKEVDELNSLKNDAIDIAETMSRYYPYNYLASNVIGFLGGDDSGQYGIEGYYNDILAGKKGILEQKRGFDLINKDGQQNLDGSDIYLTIDYNIQQQAELLLVEAKKDVDIDSGQIIVLNPSSGRVLAMANYPTYNLNYYSKEKNFDVFQNSSVQKIFEPGSVQKPFTVAIALENGLITPETKYVDEGSVKFGPDTIYNYDRKKYGEQTITGILEKSLNTGAVFISKLIPKDIYLNYLDKLGFNNRTGIDLQGETYSKNELLKKGQEVSLATSSFGQGIEMTPIQLSSAFCAFANGGKLVKPYIVDKIVSGQDVKNTDAKSQEQVFSKKTVTDVTKMLVSVVENGFGKSARLPGYYFAGKTGTAQVPIEGKRGYYADKTIQSFIGFGPALDPKFLILVKLDNPKVAASSVSAAPIFKKLAKYIVDYWQIPPDYTK